MQDYAELLTQLKKDPLIGSHLTIWRDPDDDYAFLVQDKNNPGKSTTPAELSRFLKTLPKVEMSEEERLEILQRIGHEGVIAGNVDSAGNFLEFYGYETGTVDPCYDEEGDLYPIELEDGGCGRSDGSSLQIIPVPDRYMFIDFNSICIWLPMIEEIAEVLDIIRDFPVVKQA